LGAAQCPARALRFLQRHENPWGDPTKLLALTHERLAALKTRIGGTTCAIYGDQGTGKTILGVELLRQAAQEGRTGRYATIVDLVVDLKDAEKNGKLVQAMSYWKTVDVLVVDQWDKNGMADWESRLVFAILDGRHSMERVTLIIGNCIKAADGYSAEFSRQLGNSIVQRIQETGEFILASWPRFRPTSPEVAA
jgi:DNA replication protein DnaC